MQVLLCKEPPIVKKSVSKDYTPSQQMLKRLEGLCKNTCLIWQLNDAELYYIKEHYPNYKVTPSIYAIKTALKFKTPAFSHAPSIIKKIIEGARKGKPFICTTLKKNEIDLLDELGVFYKPVKFLITSL